MYPLTIYCGYSSFYYFCILISILSHCLSFTFTFTNKIHTYIDTHTFGPWCWRRLLRVPWTARRSNQSILKEINPEYSLKGLMLTWNSNFWQLDVKGWLIRKDPEGGKDWRQKEKAMTEDETVGWHHRLDGHEFAQDLGDGEREQSLVCCTPLGHKKSDTTEQLNNKYIHIHFCLKKTLLHFL